MSDQQELRQRREALAQAVNSHDLEAVLSFIHPTFVGKTKQGFSVGYQDMVRMAQQLFAHGKDYQETVEIEEIKASGDSAKLVSRRSERGRLDDPPQFWLCLGMGIFLSGMAINSAVFDRPWETVGFAVASLMFILGAFLRSMGWWILIGLGFSFSCMAISTAVRAGEWDFQKVGGVVGFAVGSVFFIGWAFFKARRSIHRTARYQETWRTIDGRWLMVEEQEL